MSSRVFTFMSRRDIVAADDTDRATKVNFIYLFFFPPKDIFHLDLLNMKRGLWVLKGTKWVKRGFLTNYSSI